MSQSTRAASTNEQEDAIRQAQEWAEEAGMPLHLGTTIGKHPQTVILDHEYQDGVVSVNADGDIKVRGKSVDWKADFIQALQEGQNT